MSDQPAGMPGDRAIRRSIRERARTATVAGRPLMFDHRGASGPCTGEQGRRLCARARPGADGLESDTWLATDGVPVLIHDATIRLPGRRIPVLRQSSSELATFGVPFVAGLYWACGTDYALSMDIEHAAVALRLLEVAEAFDAEGALLVCSDDPALRGALCARGSRVRLMCSTDPRRQGGMPGLVSFLRLLGVDVVDLHWRPWTAASVDLVHAAGLVAFRWDVQYDAACDHLNALGVDALYGDRPDRLVGRVRAPARAVHRGG